MLDYTITLVVLSTVYCAISTCVYLLRIFHRRNRQFRFIADDIAITIAWVLLVAVYITFILLARTGFGRQLDTALLPSEAESKELAILLTTAFATGNAQLLITKLSIAFTCYRFSQISDVKLHRWLAKGVLILQFVLLTLVVPPMIPCAPLSDLWKQDVPVRHCQNFTSLLLSLSGISLGNDFILLLAPVPVIIQLVSIQGASRKYRMALWFLVFLGVLVVCGDCVQITYARGYMFGRSQDPVGAHTKQIQASLWFIFRNNVTFIVACLPQARATISHTLAAFRTRVRGSDVPSSEEKGQAGGNITSELDKVFESFRANYNKRRVTEVSEMSATEAGETSPSTKQKGFCDTIASIADDTSDWDGSDNQTWYAGPSAYALGIPTAPFAPVTPFAPRKGQWEDLYPSEDVEIKDFSEQFSKSAIEQSSTLPICFPENVYLGRSSMQKDYYDQVQRERADSASMSRQNSHVRQNSDTLPIEDFSRGTRRTSQNRSRPSLAQVPLSPTME